MSRGQNISDVAEAQKLVSALVQHAKQTGYEDALAGAARMVGIGRWSLWNILKGRRKYIASQTLGAIRKQYLSLCERQLTHLKAEVERLQERCGNDSVEDLGAATARLVERLRQARARQD